ncbi:uncharacterized protein LOC129258220 isoform X1 [Lytechinus pictus]|uniref:uncharacterized protein LOC129258220 isoform X1 n=1 Tax=Lytechinus pictus TaxID=7653 RepID=UPI0030B9CB79
MEYNCTCPKCGELIDGGSKAILWHLQNRHGVIKGRIFTESIVCMQEGCQRTFSGRTEQFKRHLMSHACTREPHGHVPPRPHGNFDNAADVDAGNDFAENIDVDIDPTEGDAEMWDYFGEDEIKERAVMLVAGLLANSSIVHTTVNEVVEKSASLVKDTCMYIKYKVQKFGAETGLEENDEFQSLLLDIDMVSHPFDNMESQYKQKKFFKNSAAFIQPEQTTIGIAYYPCNNRLTGNVQQVMKTITCQYIPIKKLITLLLEKTDLMKLAVSYVPSTDGMMHDFQDGFFCRQSRFLSSTRTIKLILYVDDFEVTNPLSPKSGTHKLTGVYFKIASVPPQYRSTLANIYLLMLFNSSDAKLYGYPVILSQLLKDLKVLESDGIAIHTDTLDGVVKVGIAQVVGDNLGIHSLFGFSEGFTANFPCRTCRMPRADIKHALLERKEVMRTPENYQLDLNRNSLQETGIKSPCILNELTHFHTLDNRAPDIMHDMLEGVCPLEVKLVLHELIRKQAFTLETLNARITSFNYGLPDASNKPCPFTSNQLRFPDGAAGQHAAQMWCLVRHIGVMLADLIQEDDEHWELIVALKQCMDIIFSSKISKGHTLFLAQLIRDHHMLFLQLFPDRDLKPKHHFMSHYPSAMQLLGPLIIYWVMRFEGKHNFSKRLAHIVCNFRNIAKTLAYRNQMQLCYNVLSNQTMTQKSVETGPGLSVMLASLEGAEIISQTCSIPLYDDIYVAQWCKVYGTEYRENMMVAVSKNDNGDAQFGNVRTVLAVGTTVFLVCHLWHTYGFKRHFHAYAVQPKEPKEITVVQVENLIDSNPLHATKSYDDDDDLYYISTRCML